MKRQMKTDKDRKPDRDRHGNRERQTSARFTWTETDENKREIETDRHRQTVKIACTAAAI